MHVVPAALTRASIQRLVLLLTAGCATVLVALALTSPSASATNFCGGQTVNSSHTCFGTPRWFEWIRAVGNSTGVCVGYNETAYLACSVRPEAGYYAEYRFGYYVYANPRVVGMSPNNTIVGNGDTF
jgi:hypothetical protein